MTTDPWIGQQLGAYQIVDMIGRGGMGSVYRALHPILERYAAIKFLRTDRVGDPILDGRFLREAQAIAHLRHPHIVQLYDFGICEDGYYMILEFIEGESLYDCLKSLQMTGRRLPHARVHRIVDQMTDALVHVHRQGLVHRDIKPANILLDSEGNAILADFGIARLLTGEGQTATGIVVGTPAYIAPEQAQGLSTDHRADLYALGVVLYEMLTGRPPYVADNPVALMVKHVQDPVPLPGQFAPDVPLAVERVLLKTLSKSPEDRYQSAALLRSALQQAWQTDVLRTEEPWQISPDVIETPVMPASPIVMETPPSTGNLPFLRTSLIGRREEIEDLKQRLTQDSAFTGLVGMGGIGKTALALVVAHELAAEGVFPDGVFWIDGRKHTTLGAILVELADLLELDVAQKTLSEQRRAVTFCLTDRDALVILDNLETVEEEQAVVEFLVGLPCAVLVTARVRLTGAQMIELSPLPADSAVRLFQLTSGLEIEAIDETASDLCALDLGGHPLAIEVVGALVAAGLDVAELQGYLREMPLDVLSETAAGAGRSVVDALQVSYQRLASLSQILLTRMSVFPGDFDLAALAALSPEHSRLHQVKGLRELVSRSLLTQISRQRYRLHPVTRQFAYALLDDPPLYHRRAGAYFMTDAGSDSLAAVEQLLQAGDEHEATMLVSEHIEKWIHAGRASKALAVCSRFTLEGLNPVERANVYEARGDLRYLLGELDEAVHQYEKAIGDAVLAGAIRRVRLHRKLADVLSRKGKYDEALACLKRGRVLIEDVSDAVVEGAQLAVGYGTVLLALGRYDDTAAEAQTALDRLDEMPAEPRIAADLYDLIGKASFFGGDFPKSLERFQCALELRQRCLDHQGVIKSYSNLAVVYGEQNRYADAMQANKAALEVAEQINDTVALTTLYANMAVDYADQGSYDQAIDFNKRSLALCEKMGYVFGLTMAHHNLGEVYRRTERFDLATDHLAQAIDLADQVGDQSGVICGMMELAEVCLAQGRAGEALAQCLESLRLAERVDDQFWQPQNLSLLGRIHHLMGQWDEARADFGQACQVWREREAWLDLSSTLLNWARLEQDAGQANRARQLCTEAASLANKHEAANLMEQVSALLLELPPTTELEECDEHKR